MTVHIITKAPYPYGMATTQRIACYAEALTKNSIKNEVVVIKRTETKGTSRNTTPNGGTPLSSFHYVGGNIFRNGNKFLGKIIDIVDRFKSISYLLKTIKNGDVIILYLLEEVVYPYILIKLAHIKGVSVVRDFCEYPYATRTSSFFTNWIRMRYLKDMLPKHDGTLCISHALLNVAKQYAQHGHHILLPIMVGDLQTHTRHHHPKPYIFHGGSMLERKDAIVSTMKAFVEANTILGKRLDFILAGPPSPHRRELDEIISQGGMEDNVFFLPIMNLTTLNEYQNGAFLSILNKNDNEQNQHGFSNKLGEVLVSGTPVITTTVGEAKYWLKDGESAYIVDPHDPHKISQKIVEAFYDDEKRIKIGEKGKEIAQKYFNTSYQGEIIKSYLKSFSC